MKELIYDIGMHKGEDSKFYRSAGDAFRFAEGASGLFGDEPQRRLSAKDALAALKRALRPKWLLRDLYPRPRIYFYYCRIMFGLTDKPPNLSWFDIHAKHASVG